jgi:hypothetical protein
MIELDAEKKLASLCKSVFGSDKGQELLEVLSEMHQEVVLFDDKTNRVYYRIGKHDLVQELKYYLSVDESQLEDLKLPNNNPLD